MQLQYDQENDTYVSVSSQPNGGGFECDLDPAQKQALRALREAIETAFYCGLFDEPHFAERFDDLVDPFTDLVGPLGESE